MMETNIMTRKKRDFLHIDLGEHGSFRVGIMTQLEKPYRGRFTFTGPFCLNIIIVWFLWLNISLISIKDKPLFHFFLDELKEAMAIRMPRKLKRILDNSRFIEVNYNPLKDFKEK